MKAELKEKWLNALRDGGYIQGVGCLRSVEGAFCCLGVLCDVIDPTAWGKPTTIGTPRHPHVLEVEDGIYKDHISTPLGITAETRTTLITLNDRRGYKFSEIASWIENNVPTDI